MKKLIRLPYAVIEDGKAKKVGTEIINIDHITNMSMGATAENNPAMLIETSTEGGTTYEIELTEAFSIHRANEFMRSLALGMHVEFINYGTYAQKITHCMDLLEIKRIMDTIGGADDISAAQVFSVLLDRLSDKYHCNLLEKPLDELIPYIREAIKLFR